jgi:hypothetical protein
MFDAGMPASAAPPQSRAPAARHGDQDGNPGLRHLRSGVAVQFLAVSPSSSISPITATGGLAVRA